MSTRSTATGRLPAHAYEGDLRQFAAWLPGRGIDPDLAVFGDQPA